MRKRKLFCKYVDVINIETSSYCNRKCDYCPLTIYPRKQNYMDKRVFERILRELDSIGYDNRIALNLYNEPLLDKYICDRVGEVKGLLPQVYVQMNSNGDYLTRDLLENLINKGLDQILITLHPLPDNVYDDAGREIELAKFLDKINVYDAYKQRRVKPNENITVEVNIKRCKVYVVCNNWRKYGNNRGGAIPKLSMCRKRDFPCNNPFREVCVDWKGAYKPCCNIYFGNVGDYGCIDDKSMLEFYFCEAMANFRRECFSFTNDFPTWCTYCNTEDNSNKNEVEIRKKILEKADNIGYMC